MLYTESHRTRIRESGSTGVFIAHVYPTDPERYWACYLSPLKFLKWIPSSAFRLLRVLWQLPPPPASWRRGSASRQVLSSARTPRLHVAARRHSAQVLCSKPSPAFHGILLPACNGGPNPPRTGRGRPAADSIVEHAADAANLGGGGRARARAGRSGCVIVGWRGGANCGIAPCVQGRAQRPGRACELW